MTEAKQRTGTPFKEVGATGVFVYVELFENYARSMELLKQNGLRPLTYQEALVLIDRNPELKEQLKGSWFYLNGKRPKISGFRTRAFYTFDNEGQLSEGNLDKEKMVDFRWGTNPSSFGVVSEDSVSHGRARFFIDAESTPLLCAPMVVGVWDDVDAAAIPHERMGDNLLRKTEESESKTKWTKMKIDWEN